VQVLWLTKKNRTVSGGGKKISSKLKIYPPPHQKSNGPSLKVTKCHKISQIVLSTLVTEIISINFVVYYWPVLKSGRGVGGEGKDIVCLLQCSLVQWYLVTKLICRWCYVLRWIWCLWCYSECISSVYLEKYAWPRWESNISSLPGVNDLYTQSNITNIIFEKSACKKVNFFWRTFAWSEVVLRSNVLLRYFHFVATYFVTFYFV
jgi:hypothetical protein